MSKKRRSSSNRRHFRFSKFQQNIALGLLAALVVAVGMYAFRTDTRAMSSEQVAAGNAASEQLTKERKAKADADAAAKSTKLVVAFLGDSYTAGTGSAGPENRWTTVLAKDQGWTEKNFGYGGTNYDTGGDLEGGASYAERVPKVIAADPDVVIVSGGGNANAQDQSAGIEKTFQDLRDGLPDAKIYAVAPFWSGGKYPASLALIAKQIEAAAESVDATYLDVEDPATNSALLSDDNIHPSDDGYAAIAEVIGKAINRG